MQLWMHSHASDGLELGDKMKSPQFQLLDTSRTRLTWMAGCYLLSRLQQQQLLQALIYL
jgi:hypothetical protein